MSRISSVLLTFILTGRFTTSLPPVRPCRRSPIVAGPHVQRRADRLQHFLAARRSTSKAADVGRPDHELPSQVNRIHGGSEKGTFSETILPTAAR
jgi:hypothetical protein